MEPSPTIPPKLHHKYWGQTYNSGKIFHVILFTSFLALLGIARDRAVLASPYFWSIPILLVSLALLSLRDKLPWRWIHRPWAMPLLLLGLFFALIIVGNILALTLTRHR